MKTSETITDISAALAKAHSEIGPAELNCVNPHFKSRYADLKSIDNAIRKPLADNGIYYIQEVITVQGGVSCSVKIHHSSGQWMHLEPLIIPVAKNAAHAVGGALTYARRYSLSAAFGVVAEEEDDGNEANANPPKEQAALLSHEQLNWLNGIIGINLNLQNEVCEAYSVKCLADIPANCWKDLCRRLQPHIEAQAKAQVQQ